MTVFETKEELIKAVAETVASQGLEEYHIQCAVAKGYLVRRGPGHYEETPKGKKHFDEQSIKTWGVPR